MLNAMLGKTTLIYVLLIERILKAAETYFEGPAGDIYAISNAGVERLHSTTSSPPGPLKSKNRMAHIDGPATAGTFVVLGTRTPMVRTSSLEDHRSRALVVGGFGGSRVPAVYLMDVWSTQELMLAGYVGF
jgi:hypothetical protein